MPQIKQISAAIVALALALPLSAFASPAFASSSSPSGAKVLAPVVFSEDEGEDSEDSEDADHEDSEDSDSSGSWSNSKPEHPSLRPPKSDHEDRESHHQIPPVVIRPNDGDNDEDDQDENESEHEDGNGFVAPGPITPIGPTPPAGDNGGTQNSSIVDLNNLTVSKQSRNYRVSPVGKSGVQTQQPAPVAANGVALDPEAAPPVEVASMQLTGKTPADVFMESATIALAALGVGAVAMGSVASARALRLRRNPRGDYFYDGEK